MKTSTIMTTLMFLMSKYIKIIYFINNSKPNNLFIKKTRKGHKALFYNPCSEVQPKLTLQRTI